MSTSPTLTLKIAATGALAEFIALRAGLKEQVAGLNVDLKVALKEANAAGVSAGQADVATKKQVTAEMEQIAKAGSARLLAIQQEVAASKKTAQAAADAAALAAQKKVADEAKTIEEEKQAYIFRLQKNSALMTGTSSLAAAAQTEKTAAAEAAALAKQNFSILVADASAASKARSAIEGSFVAQSMKQDSERVLSAEAAEVKKVKAAEASAKLRGSIEANFVMQSLKQDAERVTAAELADKARAASAIRTAAVQVEAGAAGAGGQGIGRSLTRGVAAAGGATFLTYGASIPAVAAAFAVTATIKDSISVGAAFEKEMAFVRIASDDSAASIKDLSQAVLDMGGKTIFKPVELAQGLRIITAAGFSTKDAYGALIPVMNLAALGEVSVAEAADTAQKMIHAFGLEIGDASKVGDVMVKVANASATNVKQMSEAMKQGSTVAKQYGIDINEMTAMLGVLAKVGIVGQAGGTALQNMLRGIYDPTSGKAQRALRDLQSVVPDLRPRDAAGQSQPIKEVLENLSLAAGRLDPGTFSRILTDLMNFRGAKAGINETAEAFKSFKDYLDAAKGSAGEMVEKMAILGDTVDSRWKMFKSAFAKAETLAFQGASEDLTKTLNDLTAAVLDPKFASGLTALVSNFAKFVSSLTEAPDKLRLALPFLREFTLLKGLVTAGTQEPPRTSGETYYGKITSAPILGPVAPKPVDEEARRRGLAARNTDDEALKRAMAAEDEREFRHRMQQAEQEAAYSLQILDQKHRYKLLADEQYADEVEKVNKKRMDEEMTYATEVMVKLSAAAAGIFRHDQAEKYKLAVTQATSAYEKVLELRRKAEHATDMRTGRVAGEYNLAEISGKAEATRIRDDINKIAEGLHLQQREAREAQNNALLGPVAASRGSAGAAVEKAYLAEELKLKKEMDVLEEKDDSASVIRYWLLRKEVDLLPQKREIEKAIAKNAAEDLVVRARSAKYGADKAFQAYIDAADDMGTQVGGIVTKSLKGMEDALTHFAMTGKMDFKSLANSIISDMVRMQIQASITKPLAVLGNSLLGKLFGSGDTAGMSSGSFGSWGGGIGGAANGAVFNHPSVNALSGGVYNQPTYFQFARGGVLGEAGYEAVMPLKRGADGKLGVSGGGAPNVIINVINESGQPVAAKQTGPAAFDGENYIVGVVLSAVENNPHVRNALAGAMR